MSECTGEFPRLLTQLRRMVMCHWVAGWPRIHRFPGRNDHPRSYSAKLSFLRLREMAWHASGYCRHSLFDHFQYSFCIKVTHSRKHAFHDSYGGASCCDHSLVGSGPSSQRPRCSSLIQELRRMAFYWVVHYDWSTHTHGLIAWVRLCCAYG